MYEVTISYRDEFDKVRFCTYMVKANDTNVAKNKALKMAHLNKQRYAAINDTVKRY